MEIQAIKIDVSNQQIHLIDLPNTLKAFYDQLECDLITPIHPKLSGMDFIYIDDEGLLVGEPKGAFSLIGYYGVFAGNGLVMGSDLDGNTLSCQSTVEEIAKKVRFEPIVNLPDPAFYII